MDGIASSWPRTLPCTQALVSSSIVGAGVRSCPVCPNGHTPRIWYVQLRVSVVVPVRLFARAGGGSPPTGAPGHRLVALSVGGRGGVSC